MTKPRGARTGSYEDRLRASIDYCPETGVLTWKLPPRRGVSSGSIAGSPHSRGYLHLGFAGRQLFCHRVAWFMTYGRWPDGVIDHINGDKMDNRIGNLRDVSQRVNTENIKGARSHNRLGVLGVRQVGMSFYAGITIGGRRKHLGSFKTSEQAAAAYLRAKRSLHTGCAI